MKQKCEQAMVGLTTTAQNERYMSGIFANEEKNNGQSCRVFKDEYI
jgi:hypothetical protein